ncbi:MAG: Do family serine endopeptidase [Cytophagaceae bacterium]|nr:Do family serine endopeptidase [Cytophagaceae bacterium]MDW8456887.1 Do family serine endopeptidase [Cytophagaceae bacterium]
MNTRTLFISMLVSSVLGGAITIGGYKLFFKEKKYETITESQSRYRFSFFNSSSDTSQIIVPEGINFITAADKVTPAVVHIKTMYEVSASNKSYRDPMEDIFKDFFGDDFFRGGPRFRIPHGGGKQEASGSGVILTEDGYIVTNNHVIENADKIEVTLNDKRSYEAKLIGTDPTTDLALLKIEEKGLPFVTYGNSDNVRIGEWVLAVGNPFNLTSTVTAGIVSAKARNINILRDKDNLAIESFIQTDAAVNPGNSGGALVNLRGELIGINTAIATPTGTFAGYSFAVPVTLVKKVMDDLLKYGEVQRALLGIQIQDVTADLAKEKGLSKVGGVYVGAVNEGSAAKEAGIKEGDVIIKINDVPVNNSSELQEQVARYRPGDKVKVTYERKGEIKTTIATLKNKMGDIAVVKKNPNDVAYVLGAELKPAPKEELKKLNLENGVKVTNIRDGKLKNAGVKEGFIITAVDKKKVSSPAEVLNIIDNNRNGGLLIEGVYPNGQKAYYGIGW